MEKRPTWSRFGWLALLLVLVLLLLGGLEWFDPFYFCYDDNAVQHGPWLVHNFRTLSETGELAWMNFHQMLGHPHFLAGQSGVLYWPNYVCSWIAVHGVGLPLAVTEVTSCLHLLAAAAAMYAWLRALAVPRWLGAGAALLYLTSPYLLVLAKAEVVTTYGAFYFPALLACLEWYFVRREVRFLVVAALLKAFLVLQGNVQFFLLYQLVEAVYFLARWMVAERSQHMEWFRRLGSWLFANALALALALPLIGPMQWTAARSKFRSVYSPADALAWRVDLVDWVKAQIFWFEPQRIFGSGSAAFYLAGVIVLPVLLVWLYRLRGEAKDTRWAALLMAGAVSFFLSTIGNMILSVVPFYSLMRWPYKWYQPVVMFYAALVAVLLAELARCRRMPRVWVCVFLGAALVSNVWVTLSPSGQATLSPWHFTPAQAREVARAEGRENGRTVALGAAIPETAQQRLDQRLFNYSTLYGELGFAGYDGFVDRKAAQEVFFRIYGAGLLPLPLDMPTREALNDWSVRYWLVNAKEELLAQLPGIAEVGRTPSGMVVLENRMARPMAWMEESGDALPVRLTGNRVTVQVAGRQGTTVISVLRLPGWSVRLDSGSWQPVAQETRRGQIRVPVPSGTQQLEVCYFPPPLGASCAASVVMTIVVAAAWAAYERKLRRH